MNYIKISNRILMAAFIFWILETAYFGFNMTAQSNAEVNCDRLLILFWIIAIYFYLKPLFTFYKEWVKDFKGGFYD